MSGEKGSFSISEWTKAALSSKLFLHFHFGILPLAVDESKIAGVLLQITNCRLLVPGVPSPEHLLSKAPAGHSWDRSQGPTELSPSVPIITHEQFAPQKWELPEFKTFSQFGVCNPCRQSSSQNSWQLSGFRIPWFQRLSWTFPLAGTQPRDVPGCHCFYSHPRSFAQEAAGTSISGLKSNRGTLKPLKAGFLQGIYNKSEEFYVKSLE